MPIAMSPTLSPTASSAVLNDVTSHRMHAARFDLGDLTLTSGAVLPEARLAYATHGRLNAAGDNCVLMPTYYTGTHRSYEALIGPGRALDPERWFVVIPNMFGNGESTSPSHGLGADFPAVSVLDNVRAQRRLLTEVLGVKSIALATGWSMGAIQSLHWAAAYPAMVKALLPVCGTANCWPLNRIFLEGVKAALTADGDFQGGRYARPPLKGLRAFGRAYVGWAYSAAFFRDRLYRQLGAETLDDFLHAWELEHEVWDANDLLAMLTTWAEADIGATIGGEPKAALRAITARTILMPCAHDAYFTLEEAAMEGAFIQDAELRPLLSPYGHCAGAPGRFAEETAFIEQAMRMLLSPA